MEPPVLNCPDDFDIDNNLGDCTASVTYTVTASDNCDQANVSCSHPSGSAFYSPLSEVSCTAADYSGHMDNCTFLVNISNTGIVT